MKFSFLPARGHNYHVVHETKTGLARRSAWTLCGEYFDVGERGGHQPTCPNCATLDNPLTLPRDAEVYFKAVCEVPTGPRIRSSAFQLLLRRDLLDKDAELTRRGRVLAEDWHLGPVPMSDEGAVTHAREPLAVHAMCSRTTLLVGVEDMTLSRYEKLRKVESQLVITCLSCLGR